MFENKTKKMFKNKLRTFFFMNSKVRQQQQQQTAASEMNQHKCHVSFSIVTYPNRMCE